MQTTQLSRIEGSAPMESQRVDGTFATIALVGCLSALLQFLNKAALKSGTFLLNGYWGIVLFLELPGWFSPARSYRINFS